MSCHYLSTMWILLTSKALHLYLLFTFRYINPQSTLRGYCTTSAPDHQTAENNPLLNHDGLPKFTAIGANHVVPGVNKLVSDFEQGVKDFERSLQGTTYV